MASNIKNPALSLKQFMLRQQVLKLYRDILRSIKQIPDKESQRDLRQWARHDFETNKHHTEEITIKMMIKHGERSLKELQQSLDLSSAK
ncbi:LYR motif-containing protein 2-like [Macrosteles quadrilineatus]|uniref:LYR motif-containing protein 2-like n=1 Tax=Macrosteles quadrilineatus TaxID=74068 RepID=UPI0023E10AA1|nr:LYR motif-containing protein 2-like [Macrosteles quadrilineatus]